MVSYLAQESRRYEFISSAKRDRERRRQNCELYMSRHCQLQSNSCADRQIERQIKVTAVNSSFLSGSQPATQPVSSQPHPPCIPFQNNSHRPESYGNLYHSVHGLFLLSEYLVAMVLSNWRRWYTGDIFRSFNFIQQCHGKSTTQTRYEAETNCLSFLNLLNCK